MEPNRQLHLHPRQRLTHTKRAPEMLAPTSLPHPTNARSKQQTTRRHRTAIHNAHPIHIGIISQLVHQQHDHLSKSHPSPDTSVYASKPERAHPLRHLPAQKHRRAQILPGLLFHQVHRRPEQAKPSRRQKDLQQSSSSLRRNSKQQQLGFVFSRLLHNEQFIAE